MGSSAERALARTSLVSHVARGLTGWQDSVFAIKEFKIQFWGVSMRVKFIKTALTVATAVMLNGALWSSFASATTITFDNGAGNWVLNTASTDFDDSGLHFDGASAYYMAVQDGTSPNSNGTNNLINGYFGDVIITRIGGGSFSLDSLQLAVSWYDGNPSEIILINGAPLSITQSLQTFNLNLDNVTSVTIGAIPNGYWTADNIVFSMGAVPEPSTWAMMILGFVGFAGLAYRRKRQLSLI